MGGGKKFSVIAGVVKKEAPECGEKKGKKLPFRGLAGGRGTSCGRKKSSKAKKDSRYFRKRRAQRPQKSLGLGDKVGASY